MQFIIKVWVYEITFTILKSFQQFSFESATSKFDLKWNLMYDMEVWKFLFCSDYSTAAPTGKTSGWF